MNLGSRFPIPREKGVIQKNGNIWIPSTPDKHVSQRSNNAQSDIQQNQTGEENWQNLLGIYTGVLRESLAGPSPEDHNIRPVPPGETFNRFGQNQNPTMVFGPSNKGQSSQNITNRVSNATDGTGASNVRDFITLEEFARFSQNARSVSSSSSVRNSVEVVLPKKVNSLAELVDTTRTHPSGGTPNRSISAVVRPTNIYLHSQVESNRVAHAPFGGWNLHEMTNKQNYNLNLPPRPDAGESSSTGRPFPLGPVTPDLQKQSRTYQISQVPQLSTGKTSSQEKCTRNEPVFSRQPYTLVREHTEKLLNTPCTSAAVISTESKEMNNCDGENGRIDLNQTPQQKPPKRKKHRPKVVTEGKAKRGPKSAAPKGNPEGNPKAKRKYVQRKCVKTSTTAPLADNAVEASDGRPAKKARKRRLNFDLENTEGDKLPFNLNLDTKNAEWSAEFNGPPTSIGTDNTCGRKKHQIEIANIYVHPVNKVTTQESMPLANMGPPHILRDHTLNVIARSLNMRNVSAKQSTNETRYNRVNHCISGGLGQRAVQANTSLSDLLCRRKQSTVADMPQHAKDLVNVTEIEGAERLYTHTETIHSHIITLMGSQLWSNEISEMGHRNIESSSLWRNGLDTGKKMNVEGKYHGTSSGTPSGVATDEDFSGQIGSRRCNFPIQSSAVMHQRDESANSDIRRQSIKNPKDKLKKVTRDWCMNYADFRPKFQQQHASSKVCICSEQVALKTSHSPVTGQSTNSLTVVTNRNQGSASQRDPKSIPINDILNSTEHVAVKRHTSGTSSNKVPIVGKSLEREDKNRRNYRNSSKKVTGSQERMVSIDYITDLLKDLHINNDGQRALVPYKGNAAVVPYEEFDLVRKRQPRPRVDLDPETDRLWNLLMSKAGESAQPMDNDKQKWWEEERKVFQGRVDSFIARMHLVQGDRRFSKWKGSVVDSVIGVFLTQNVSDHLSSSAFMSLAAKFPLKKSTTVCQPCGQNGGSISVEHPEVHVTFPDGTSYVHGIPREPACNHSSVTYTDDDSSEYMAKNVMTEKRRLLVKEHTRKIEEDIISSQSSSESFFFQAYEDIRSSSGSNSEAEDGWNLSRNLGYPSEQAERIAASQQYHKGLLFDHQQLENTYSYPFISKVPYNQPSVLPSTNNYWPDSSLGLEKWEADVLAFSGKESISTLASTQLDIINGTGVEHGHDYKGQRSENTYTGIQNGIPKFQVSPVNHAIPNKHLDLNTDFLGKSENRNGQHFIRYARGMQESFQESTFLMDRTRPAEAFSKQPSDSWKQAGDTTHESTKTGQVNSCNNQAGSNIGTTTLNERKGKVEKEKAPPPFHWDTLRKQVPLKAGTKGRSMGTMDSMDYEALRNADVREISDTIKERGMNNMLAERMKSFLNRLVQDHERIDLEWLREAEPDKVKDYLLSIRGLGLKSVECIRLLTLHHLAFPVDTNVGRIAVRLGWVPLRPLPESLQLHLLELYPVLESIQKYLWPRLCNLDQETLYELHYQMITFGKVFCTKREPNCNACPMKGECRHFASAFASARLALPGPEEKHIVRSSVPVIANKGPDMIIKPLPLISPEGNIERRTGLTRNCEPLIEEPTTPEPPKEVSERDIEDAFYEDSDEIPVIKLDVQEFTTNLQSVMQEQMEMGEADMSKAIVALSPELGSIPIPKLKHVSRLRTEHQVYELPDSHPLLKGIDRREPDDPSPYLLAIWTPGETADSVQPLESTCSSREGGDFGLCNNKACFTCNSTREAQAQTVKGTILIPCRTAMRGSFPLNGTYFQVNEVFADHESSLNPIDVPRNLLWNLPRRTVFFGTSVSTIFKGMTTVGIQYCFWKGFVCVRGFDHKTRAPRPLRARLHLPASKLSKQNE
ncbi:hypothetical protein OROMI_001264 [Orobanche minor]